MKIELINLCTIAMIPCALGAVAALHAGFDYRLSSLGFWPFSMLDFRVAWLGFAPFAYWLCWWIYHLGRGVIEGH